MSDLFVISGSLALIGSAAAPVTLEDSFSVALSALIDISKASYIQLGVNYTQGAAESGNILDIQYEVAGKKKVSKTAATIAFTNDNPDTITDSGNGFLTAGFTAGQVIVVTGSGSNNGVYTIASVTAGTITLISTDSLTVESAGAMVKIEAQTGGFYRLQTETVSGGDVTRATRLDHFTAVASPGAYDTFIVTLQPKDIAGWDTLRVYVSESGVASNYGNCWVEAVKIGR